MIKLFTHSDLDGVGCAVLAKLIFEHEEGLNIEYCDYDNINEKVSEFLNKDDESLILITDISVNVDIAEKLNKRGNVWLIDHHPTAIWLNKYFWCNVKIENKNGIKTSGTEMFYNWLINHAKHRVNPKCYGWFVATYSIKQFVEIVRDYDTWRWMTLENDGVMCKQVNDLLYLYGREKFIDWCLHGIEILNVFPVFKEEDYFVLELKQKEIDDYIQEKDKQIMYNTLLNKNCGIVFAEKYISELGNRLCEMNPEIDFIVIINMASQTVSYRTIKDNIDLGKDIAAKFGGGGHPKAAGSKFSDDILQKTIENIFEV